MTSFPSRVFLLCAGFSLSAQAQIYKFHNAEVAVGGTGQYTTSITSQLLAPHQAQTNSVGFLLSYRDDPFRRGFVELNYQYSSFSERFVSQVAPYTQNSIPAGFHEGTAAYVVSPHYRKLTPFVGVGGGVAYFNPSSPTRAHTQMRPAGLVEFGLDVPTSNRRLGFRLESRALAYRAPNFNNPDLATHRWVIQSEPSRRLSSTSSNDRIASGSATDSLAYCNASLVRPSEATG